MLVWIWLTRLLATKFSTGKRISSIKFKPLRSGQDELYDDVCGSLKKPIFKASYLKCETQMAAAMNESLEGMCQVFPEEVNDLIGSYAKLVDSYLKQGTLEIYGLIENLNEYQHALLEVIITYQLVITSLISVFCQLDRTGLG
jgi:hypothetical protein